MSNFQFLEHNFSSIFERARQAENLVFTDHRTSLMLSREVLERIVKWVYSNCTDLIITKIGLDLKSGTKVDLHDLLCESEFQNLINSKSLVTKLFSIKKYGNYAIHIKPVNTDNSKTSIVNLYELSCWFFYTLNEEEKSQTTFDFSIIPIEGQSLSRAEFDELQKKILQESFKFENELKLLKNRNINLLKENNELQKGLEDLENQLLKANKILANENIHAKAEIRELQINSTTKNSLEIIDIGITEQIGKIWGRVFVNLIFCNKKFFAVKYFSPNSKGKATERFFIAHGEYQESNLYSLFPNSLNGLVEAEVLEGKYDYIILSHFYKLLFKTPSLLLERLRSDLAIHFGNQFNFFGSYYYVNGVNYRNLLEIIESKAESSYKSDVLVIMMNPGGSSPIDSSQILEKSFTDTNKTELIKCIPDETQHQIIRLMNINRWKKGYVINLLDICESNSDLVLNSIMTKGEIANEKLVQSIFHKDRRNELDTILGLLQNEAPIVLAWGVDQERKKLRDKVKVNILHGYQRQIIGYSNQNGEYYHPWPRDNQEIRLNWPDEVNFDYNKNK